jgi:hypothetical protein
MRTGLAVLVTALSRRSASPVSAGHGGIEMAHPHANHPQRILAPLILRRYCAGCFKKPGLKLDF